MVVVVFDATNTPAFIRRQNHEKICLTHNTAMQADFCVRMRGLTAGLVLLMSRYM